MIGKACVPTCTPCPQPVRAVQGRARGTGAAKVHAPDGRYAQSFEVVDMMPLGAHVRRVQLTNYERIARPAQYMDEIQARRWRCCIAALHRSLCRARSCIQHFKSHRP